MTTASPLGGPQARQHRGLFAEIAREGDHPDVRILTSQSGGDGEGVVRAPVVDQDQFHVGRRAEFGDGLFQFVTQPRQVLRLAIARHHDGQEGNHRPMVTHVVPASRGARGSQVGDCLAGQFDMLAGVQEDRRTGGQPARPGPGRRHLARHHQQQPRQSGGRHRHRVRGHGRVATPRNSLTGTS